jgi:sarcosine oxidase subunit beta
MSRSYDVVVVGAGITGASTAYHLLRENAGKVLLIEREIPAAGGTGKSAAIVRQHYSTALAARLTKDSIDQFMRMPEELGASGGFVRSGWRMLVPAEMMDAARKNIEIQQSVGVVTELLDGAAAAAELPWLNPEGIAGIAYEPDGGYADPVQSTEAFVEAFKNAGGEVKSRTPVRALLGDSTKITGVMTEAGPIHAGAVVNAAGPWSGPLANSVGLELPLRAVREQETIWEMRAERPIPDTPVSDALEAIYLRPLGDRRFVIGRGFPKDYVDADPYNFKHSPDEEFVSDILQRMEIRFPTFQGAKRIDAFAALYDVTVDWYPFVGPRSGVDGYFDASGGSGHGFKIGPAIGKELAGWIANGRAADDFRQLSYDRVHEDRLFIGAYGGNRG